MRTPSLSIMCPEYATSGRINSHLSGCSLRFAAVNLSINILDFSLCSSVVLLKLDLLLAEKWLLRLLNRIAYGQIDNDHKGLKKLFYEIKYKKILC